jgi:magnesium chelatase subunit D
VPEAALEALCTTALALGIDSLRAPLLALRAARAAAALDARDEVDADDLTLAARLVLAPRATRVPTAASADDDEVDEAGEADEAADPPPQQAQTPQASELSPENRQDLEDSSELDQDEQPPALSPEMLDAIVLEAARAAIPEGLLQQLGAERAMAQSRGKSGGRTGAERAGRQRGRPVGSRPGLPRDGARLAVIDTLRAAAPWQRLRQQATPAALASAKSLSTPRPRGARVQVRASDFRVMRLQERAQTTTVFAVDASGSSALHRLAEAKGAVELLLAECYVRRDQVAVVAFRGRGAEVLLAPTRSLARARRELSGLPGGGGTPLSQGIETAAMVADGLARKGGTPIVVLLTDGKANVAHDGTGGRAQALTDAREAAQRLRLAGHACMLIDTSPRPSSDAQDLAQRMGAAYIALPHADAAALSRSVQAASRAVTGSAT